jgi:hypothetical protein
MKIESCVMLIALGTVIFAAYFVSCKAKIVMMKKIKNAKPSVIFQLVIVVALFSCSGSSPDNDSVVDIPVAAAIENGYTLKLPARRSAEPENVFATKPVIGTAELTMLPAVNGYFYKQFIFIKPDRPGVAGIHAGVPINAVQGNRR